jgi:phosphatidylglycerophosphate synthase
MERIPAWMAIVLIMREFLITALRVVALSRDIIIPAELGGKLKTTAQISAILCLILTGNFLIVDLYDVGIVLIWVALVLAVVSGVKYTLAFWRTI